MALKSQPIVLGTSDTDVYVCPATTEASVHGLVFANATGSAVTITLKAYKQNTGTTTTVISGFSVAANSAFTWPKPINLNAADKLIASASSGSAIVALYSAYEGSASVVNVGFTPRGTWSSSAEYAVNDVVYLSGTSYLALQSSTNQNPSTATAYWMILSAKGETGAQGIQGEQGIQGIQGIQGVQGEPGQGVATGGTTGQVLKKASNANYDTTWGALTADDVGALESADIGVLVPSMTGYNNMNWDTAYGWGNHASAGYLASSTASSTYAPISTTVTLTGTQTLSGKTITGLRETRVAIAASDIDLSLGNYFTRTISGTTTLTVSNTAAAGTVSAFVLDLTNGGSATVNWFSGVKWAGGTAPTLTSSGRDVVAFFTHDGGTTWNGFVLGRDVK